MANLSKTQKFTVEITRPETIDTVAAQLAALL